MCRTREGHPNPGSIALFLRTRAGLTQSQLARFIGLTPNDISRFERDSVKTTIGKAVRLAQYYGTSVEDLVHDNYASVLPTLAPMPPRDPEVAARFRQKQLRRIEIGELGERFIAALEREKLRGTRFECGVNAAYANDPSAGFDIMSFTATGIPRYIEVKTTTGDVDEPFFMTDNEYRFMLRCVEKGTLYELHRVYWLKDEEHAKVKVYTAQELMQDFAFIVNDYCVTRRCA